MAWEAGRGARAARGSHPVNHRYVSFVRSACDKPSERRTGSVTAARSLVGRNWVIRSAELPQLRAAMTVGPDDPDGLALPENLCDIGRYLLD